MAFFDKLNQVAKNLGDKTSDVIETTKLNSKLAAEKLSANEELLKIGQFYYNRYLMGQAEPDITEYCEAAKKYLDNVARIQADIDNINMKSGTTAVNNTQSQYQTQSEYQAQPKGVFCMNCGTNLPVGTKFCNVCGQRLDA